MKHDVRWWAFGLAAALAALPAGVGARDTSKGGALADEKLREGVQKLHAGDQKEVQLGRLGVQRAASPAVRQFAQRMVDDHSQNDQKLGTLARSLGVPLTGDAFQKEQQEGEKTARELQGKSGRDFDRAYMKQMVRDHEKDVREFGKLAARAREKKQPELASFLAKTEQTMGGHLSMARDVQRGRPAAAAGASNPGGTGAGPSDRQLYP